jgi:two-component system OmpR family sensor kinase
VIVPLRFASRAPIFTSSFLLSLAALCVAELIGLMLMLTSPPVRNAPVPVSVVARLLDPAQPVAEAAGPGPASTRRKEIRVGEAAGQVPAPPADIDGAASDAVKRALAAEGGYAIESLTVYVRSGHTPPPPPGPPPGPPPLGEGFYVALRLPDGHLRVVESVLEAFPNAFHRQVFWLLALGAMLLLPLAWIFSTALATPIRRFAKAAHRVGTDPNAAALPVEGPAEIRRAAESFNLMQARIQRLLEERTEMIAAIAHDLRTPLARLSFRLDELPEPAQRRAAADIDEMTSMISRTLDFCRGRAVAQARDPLDFRLLVEAVVDDYTDTGAPVSLAPSGAVVVHADAVALRRAIGNLVDNALKYGARARLTIQTSATDVTLLVDDDGPGIPEALQARALRPFTRLDDSRGREMGGIGLGLTVVRATVLDHGGDLKLENRAEGGLRVSLRLPTPDSAPPTRR